MTALIPLSTESIGDLTTQHLRSYFSRLIKKVREQQLAVRVSFHFDNLDLLAQDCPDQLRRFFEETRDILQEPNVYFIFVGYKGMFQQIIVPSERVRSVFLTLLYPSILLASVKLMR